MRPRTWKAGRWRIHTCVLWPECWRERKHGFRWHWLAVWKAMDTSALFGVGTTAERVLDHHRLAEHKSTVTVPHPQRCKAVMTDTSGQRLFECLDDDGHAGPHWSGESTWSVVADQEPDESPVGPDTSD